MHKKKLLYVLIVSVMLLRLFPATPVLSDGGTPQRIVVTRTLNGSTSSVTVWEGDWTADRTVKFDAGTGVGVTLYATGGTPNWYFQLQNDNGYNDTWDGPSTSHTFWPYEPIESDYRAFVDGIWVGGLGEEFHLRAAYPDLDVINLHPASGSPSSPFCVGQAITWEATVRNTSLEAKADSSNLGYYIGTSSSDFSNRFGSEPTGPMFASSYVDLQESYTFVATDVGTRYINAWADYQNDVDEENEGNNKTSSLPFIVADVPVAQFAADQTGGTRPFTVNFTDQSTGNPDSWAWDFGDGSTSTQQNPSHTYDTAGDFTVSLTVSGPCGSDTETKTNYIHITEPAPVADFTGSPTSGTRPLTVDFSDQSTGSITSRSWDFGDGSTSTQQSPSHTYDTAGDFTVSLTVNGPGGSDTETKTNYIHVTEPAPVADFTGSPTSGTRPLTVDFSDQSTGTITGWSWDFGDGNTSTQQNPSHTYDTAGDFTVSLTVNGPGGSDTETKTNYIHVTEPAPVADFTGSPTSGTRPLTVDFSDQSTGSITSRSWDFGDGSTSTQQNPSHTYDTAGDFTVSLTVNGPGGSDTETKTDYIHVDSDVTLEISQVKVTNVRDTSFVVSWLTNIDATGHVNYGTTTALGDTARDDRGASYADDTHYVTVSGLSSNMTYYFDVVSGSTVDDNGGAHYQVTTGPTLSLPGSDTAYGQVFNSDGTTYAQGTIVYMTLVDRDGGGDPGTSAEMSALVDSNGYWFTNLGNARAQDLGDYFEYSSSGDTLSLHAQGAADGEACTTVDTGSDAPADPLILGTGCDTGPTVIHTPVTTATENTPVPISATITSDTLPISATLHYQVTGAPDFTDTLMSNTLGDVYEATIPPSAVTVAGVDYYISATDGEYTTTHPPTGAHHILVPTFCDTVSEIPKSECEALVALYNTTAGSNWTDNTGWLDTNTPCSWYGVTCAGDQVKHITELHLENNNLNGNIPVSLSNLAYLMQLSMWHNQLTGSIPAELANLTNLVVLQLDENQLSGGIPRELGYAPSLVALQLATNHLTGTIPIELADLPAPDNIILSNNQLSGIIPPELGRLTSLHHLHVDNNQLTGTIPAELGDLTNLLSLKLNDNQLSGNIPLQIGSLSNLVHLYLNNNQLAGNIPSDLGNLINLHTLHLENNALEGEIPNTMVQLVNLNSPPSFGTDFGYNKLTASDPTVIAFLNDKDPDWAATQTVPPTDVGVVSTASSSVQLSWTPIPYTGDGGFYEVGYATTSGGPYAVHGTTSDKSASGYTADNLDPDTTYYFVLRTYTPVHGEQQNELWSDYSQEVSATTTIDNPCYAKISGSSTITYTNVQAAVDAANDGDTVKIAGYCAGVEVRFGLTQTVYISKHITLRGGYSADDWTTSDPNTNLTTLDAQGQGRVVYITGDISPTLEGLRMTGGNAAGLGGYTSPWGDVYDAGGGLYIITATVTISNNQIFSNTAERGGGLYIGYSNIVLKSNLVTTNTADTGDMRGSGGGLYLVYSDATLSGNTISSNTSTGGGGLDLWHSDAILSENTITSNSALQGGGLVIAGGAITLANNIIAANTADWHGGGLYVSSSASFSANTITANAAEYGGGLYLANDASNFNGNIFTSNTADEGGGLYLSNSAATFANNIVADNQASMAGSALYIQGSSPRLQHITLARNTGGDGSGIYVTEWGPYSTVALTNTILVSHTVGITVTVGNTATLEATLWGNKITDWGGLGTVLTGSTNLWGDPAFVDPNNGDYHIGASSAALDAGVNAGVSDDMDGDLRPYGSGYDIGADEFTFCANVSEIPQSECQALVAFYTSTDGPNWNNKSGWLDTNTPCGWYGVTCSEGHVAQLNLGNNLLSGSIPRAVGDLSSLEGFMLNSNQLSGAIPSELGSLTSLASLRLENNALEGEISITITNLNNLTDTNFGYNKLTASDPAVIAFLNDKDPDWAHTQTVPPSDVHVERASNNNVILSWTPIAYTGDGGHYQISYATTPGGPYTIHGTTGDKNAIRYTADNLDPGTTYYFVVRTYTPAHGEQQNDLLSSASQEVLGFPQASPIFEDGFSTDKGWINETSGDFSRDTANEWLSWHVDRSTDEKYYIPIGPLSGDFRLEAKVKATYWANNCNFFFGLAESLTGGIFNGPAPTGLFVDFGWYGGYPEQRLIRAKGIYADQSPYEGDRITYNMDEWYRIVFEVVGLDWAITVYDEGQNKVGQTTGTFPVVHSSFNYLILWSQDDGDWPTGDGLVDNIRVFGQYQTDYPLNEEFDSSENFTQTDPDVYISDGQVHWTVSRSEGEQYVYRDISAFQGDLRLTVRGQIDSWSNNCRVHAGIGDGPGSGVSVDFAFVGGGCPTNGPVVAASGVSMDYSEQNCVFTGNWLWIGPGTPYEAQLTLSGGSVTLTVPGVGTSTGTPVYAGSYDTLYVGLTGDGDGPSCSGMIDSIQVEPLLSEAPSSNPVYLPLILKDR